MLIFWGVPSLCIEDLSFVPPSFSPYFRPSNNPPHASPILSLNLVNASLGSYFLLKNDSFGRKFWGGQGVVSKNLSQNRELYIWRPTPRQKNTFFRSYINNNCRTFWKKKQLKLGIFCIVWSCLRKSWLVNASRNSNFRVIGWYRDMGGLLKPWCRRIHGMDPMGYLFCTSKTHHFRPTRTSPTNWRWENLIYMIYIMYIYIIYK